MPWSSDGWSGGVAAPAGLYVNAEVNALAINITPTPSGPWLTACDTMVTALKAGGVWANLDLFYCFAAPSANACTWNWIDTNSGRLTANGNLNYVANSYCNSDGTTGWFSSTFNVNSGDAQDGNAHFGYFVLNEDLTDAISPFQTSGGKHYLGLQANPAAINNLTAGLNTSTAASFSSVWGSSAGHWVLQQNNLTSQLELFMDGVSSATSTQTHSADTGTVQVFKTVGNAFTNRQTSFVHYGAKLTANQHFALSKALYTFLTAMDIRPKAGFLGLSTGPTNAAPYKHCSTGNGNNLTMPVTTNTFNTTGLLQGRAGAYPYSVIRVNDPNYMNLFRFEIHRGDGAPFDGTSIDRIQFSTPQTVNFQVTCDFSYSIFVEVGSVNGNTYWDLSDFYDSGGAPQSGPTPGVDPATGNFYIWAYQIATGSYVYSTYVPLVKGVWHNVRILHRQDNSPNGFIQAWYDGTQIMNYSGAHSDAAHSPYKWQIACYRGGTTNGSGAVWYGNIEIDFSGSAPFASRVSNPLPLPVLT